MPDIKKSQILIIATNGFEQAELELPRDKLREAGAKVDVASPDGDEIRGWNEKDWGHTVPVDLKIGDAKMDDYDALVIPGGVMKSGQASHRRNGNGGCQIVPRKRQGCGGCLPWSVAAGAGRCAARPPGDVL